MLPEGVLRAAENAQRAHWGRVLAATMRLARDLDVAEEATADAFLLALQTWPRSGVPDSVEAWLLTTARRRAIDRIRREVMLRQRLAELRAVGPVVGEPADAGLQAPVVRDDELRLLVLCCHPALTPETQVALTLRLAIGAATAVVAAAFLVRETTMAARLTRAKRLISRRNPAGRPRRLVELPDDASVAERLPSVRRVVHLAYSLGHTSGAGSTLREEDLAGRALRLARVLYAWRPADRESAGLLALLLLSEARAPGRLGPDGGQVLLADADRSRWNTDLVDEGLLLACRAGFAGTPGPYALQAAIAAEQTRAPRHADVDWGRIVELYGRLLTLEPSPTLALGRSLAVAELSGPRVGLADLEGVLRVGGLEGYPYAHAARAQLLGRLGRTPEARRAWTRAASCARTTAEREWFSDRATG